MSFIRWENKTLLLHIEAEDKATESEAKPKKKC